MLTGKPVPTKEFAPVESEMHFHQPLKEDNGCGH